MKGLSRTISTIMAIAAILCLLGTPARATTGFRAYDLTQYTNTEVDLPGDAGFTRANTIWPPDSFTRCIQIGKAPHEEAIRGQIDLEKDPGPIIFDIETNFYLNTNDPAIARTRADIAIQILIEAKAYKPSKEYGFYGYLDNTIYANLNLAKEVAQYEDSFFPEMYTREGQVFSTWNAELNRVVILGHDIDASKPIVPFLWPQYYRPDATGGEFISHDVWRQQLNALRTHAQGVTIWSQAVNEPLPAAPNWYTETIDFMQTVPSTAKAATVPHPTPDAALLDPEPNPRCHGDP